MAVRWSRIHAELGEVPGDLTFEMVEAAVAAKIAEATDLDWKESLPGKEEAQLQEFAKDVAAMANTTGGLIVYGVREDRGTGRADKIVPVDNSESAQRRLRSLAASRIHPLVAGLDLVPLASADGTQTLLVVSVPRSPDAPHIIGRDNALGAPFRSGPETQWMREREIERAYRERFQRLDDERARLMSMLAETDDRLDQKVAPWLVAVARPRTPLAGIVRPPSADDVTRVLEATQKYSLDVLPRSDSRHEFVHVLGYDALYPRVGLRRWIARTARIGSSDSSDFVHVELHHDGSVVLAVALGALGPLPKAPDWDHLTQVSQSAVESFAADFAALTDVYARHLGAQAPMSFHLDIRGADRTQPLVVTESRRVGGAWEPPAHVLGSTTLRAFRSITGELSANSDIDALRAIAREIAGDVLNQFGIAELKLLA